LELIATARIYLFFCTLLLSLITVLYLTGLLASRPVTRRDTI